MGWFSDFSDSFSNDRKNGTGWNSNNRWSDNDNGNDSSWLAVPTPPKRPDAQGRGYRPSGWAVKTGSGNQGNPTYEIVQDSSSSVGSPGYMTQQQAREKAIQQSMAAVTVDPNGVITAPGGVPLPPNRASEAAQRALRDREVAEMESSQYYDPNSIFNQASTGDILSLALNNETPAIVAQSAAAAAARRVGGHDRLEQVYGKNIANHVRAVTDWGNLEQGWEDNFNFLNPLAMGEQRPNYSPGVDNGPNANWYFDPLQQAIGMGVGALSPVPGVGSIAGMGYGALSNGATQIGLGPSVIGQPDQVRDPVALNLSQQVALGRALGLDVSAQEQQLAEQRSSNQPGNDHDGFMRNLQGIQQIATPQQQVGIGTVLGNNGQAAITRDRLLEAARNAARFNVDREFHRRGLNPDEYRESLIDPRFDEIASSISPSSTSFDTYFGPGLGADIIDTEQQGRRSSFLAELDQLYGTGFDTTLLPNTADDQYIDMIYNDRFQGAQGILNNALARGTLSGSGYSSALGRLQNQGTTARSTLSNLGEGVLGNVRQDLRGEVDTARTRASEYRLGGDFSVSTEASRIDDFLNERKGNLEGDIRGALGGTSLFDPQEAINAGGAAQGFVPGSTSPSMFGRSNRSARRGIGNTGAF